jgi:flagellar motor protein MotB
MEKQGLRPAQVLSVRGHADRQLRVPESPADPRNRRISIVVKNPTLPAAGAVALAGANP